MVAALVKAELSTEPTVPVMRVVTARQVHQPDLTTSRSPGGTWTWLKGLLSTPVTQAGTPVPEEDIMFVF